MLTWRQLSPNYRGGEQDGQGPGELRPRGAVLQEDEHHGKNRDTRNVTGSQEMVILPGKLLKGKMVGTKVSTLVDNWETLISKKKKEMEDRPILKAKRRAKPRDNVPRVQLGIAGYLDKGKGNFSLSGGNILGGEERETSVDEGGDGDGVRHALWNGGVVGDRKKRRLIEIGVEVSPAKLKRLEDATK